MSPLTVSDSITPRSDDGPFVSVVLPTYNDSQFIDTAIESVFSQSHENIELIIIDSSGVDRLQEFSDRTAGVEYVSTGANGAGAARNRGISKASGDVVAFLDADDYWRPDKLEKQLATLEAGADIVYSDQYVVENGRERYQSSLPIEDSTTHYVDYFRKGEGVPSRTVVVRRKCLDDERFDESLEAHEDPHLWVRLFATYEPGRIPEPLAYKRQRPDSLTGNLTMVYENELAAIEDLVERYPTLEKYRAERERRTAYRHGRALLRSGRQGQARNVLLSVVRDGLKEPRILVLLAISMLPAGHQWILHHLERVNRYV